MGNELNLLIKAINEKIIKVSDRSEAWNVAEIICRESANDSIEMYYDYEDDFNMYYKVNRNHKRVANISITINNPKFTVNLIDGYFKVIEIC